ncbi:hypothetical protein [Lunatibacter salilacus]|uniref:hypothetical protein n=1 Tax=Lunatibacter salilacus TaxID=2483804 RepID=UPI00131C6DA2|nr:hypothetical protein [Lunatibacter salilacus]
MDGSKNSEIQLSCYNAENIVGEPDLQAASKLKSLVPLSKSTLRKLLPEKVGRYLKTQTLIGHKEPIEISAIQCTYHHEAEISKTILIDIMDGAGPIASVLLAGSIQKLNSDFEEIKTDGFSRILERNGQRVWEAENRKEGIAELEFIHAGRFLVSIKGTHLQHEDLWDFAAQLEFTNLQ